MRKHHRFNRLVDEIPDEQEQAAARRYVLERFLTRPDTDFKKAVKYVILFIVGTLSVGCLLLYLIEWSSILPDDWRQFQQEHPIIFHVLFFLGVYMASGLLCLKTALIGAVKLYQHYSYENVRRRCLFQPTCSEYAILSIQKYGVAVGLWKTYDRLVKRCRGTIYRIDYP